MLGQPGKDLQPDRQPVPSGSPSAFSPTLPSSAEPGLAGNRGSVTQRGPQPKSKPLKSRDTPKLRYRRVQEMIKEHTAKNQETKLDREVKDNLQKLNKLCQMKADKFGLPDHSRIQSIGSSVKQLSHGSSAVMRSEARNSDIHEVLPAPSLTPRITAKKSLTKPGKAEASRDKASKPRGNGKMPQNLSKFCTNCGAKFQRNTYRFCGECGHVRSTIVN